MRIERHVVLAALCAAVLGVTGALAEPVGTAFTYQGQIKDGGVPANGTYDLRFRLYDSADGGAPIGDIELKAGEEVVNGLFTVTLDFGPTAFAGEQRWLEVAVRHGGGGLLDPFTILSPRQQINAAPYALYALNGAGSGGHWAVNGVDIYNTNSGKVGIGTNTPADMLHVTGTNPTLRLQDDSESESYTVLQDDASIDTAQLEKRVSSGVPTVEISPMPIDTVSDARIRFFRRTNTSGAKVVIFNRGYDSSAVSALIGVDGYDSYFQLDGGDFGIHTMNPLAPLHVLVSDQSLDNTALYGEDLILEDADAVLGLFSSPAGNYGSAFGLTEINGGALVDKWTVYRTTSGANPASQLRFSFGSNANYSLNPTRLALSADGSVGIGTTAPAFPLHLAGTAQIMQKIVTSNTAGTWLDLENTSTGGKRWGILTTGSANGEGAGHLILRAITDGRSVMTLKGTGDVGIGTTAPQARLHVDGGTETTPGGGGYLVVGRTDSTNISFDDNEIQARILGIAAPLLVNPAGGSIHLIQSGSGRVGIGTSSPNAAVKLDVVTSGSETAVHGRGGAVGVAGWGSHSGGYFKDSNGSGEAWLGTMVDTLNDGGIVAQSVHFGAKFSSTSSGNYLVAGTQSWSLYGNGSKDFVQNHPYERNKVIHYSCLEGDEVGTYTRGSGQLVNGEARITLGETFRWVTNPDIGLTAHLTPRDQAVPLAVVSLTTEELVVRGPEGGPTDVTFDYIIHGLRIGFEEAGVVREKTMEAYIPSMTSLEEAYATDPGLRRFNALERFKAMRTAEGETASLDLSRAEALRDAITVYNPAVHQMPHPPRPEERAGNPQFAQSVDVDSSGHPEQANIAVTPRGEKSEVDELRARVEALETLIRQMGEAVSGRNATSDGLDVSEVSVRSGGA